MSTKRKKRGVGRPKLEPMSGPELRQKALSGMRLSAEAKGHIDYEEAEEGLEIILDENRLKKATAAELKELRRMAERLWDKLQIEKEYEHDQEWEGGYGVSREPTPQSEAWEKQHEFLKPKRKNAKKIKNIHTLTDKQKLRKGMSLEPTAMEFDVDATEAQLEKVLMEEAMLRKQREQQYTKGRRITGRKKVDPQAQQRKNFWS